MRLPVAALLAMAACQGWPAGASEPLKIDVKREGDDALRVRVTGAIPKGALVQLRVARESRTPTRQPPKTVHEGMLVCEREGEVDAALRLGEEMAVPGRYRVRASVEPQAQYPAVRDAMKGDPPGPAEVVLNEGLASRAYLEASLKEQAYLAGALLEIGDFLDKLNGFQDLVREDREKGVAAWGGWRGKAVPGLENIIQHGRQMRDRFYPETYNQFAEGYCFAGLFQAESRMFSAAKSGGPAHMTGAFKDRTVKDGRLTREAHEELVPYVAVFRAETVYVRLAVGDALFSAISDEVALQEKRPDQERWGRKLAGWRELLALWRADLGPSRTSPEAGPPPSPPEAKPPEVREVMHREELAALADAFEAWWTAAEARMFPSDGPEKSGGAQAAELQKMVRDRFQAVITLLEPKR